MTQTILVVDDDLELRKLVQSYLIEEGFRAVTAANGREAIFVAREEQPDLIVLDLMMPEMGGYEFLHAYGKEADVPVIILTAKMEDTARKPMFQSSFSRPKWKRMTRFLDWS